MLHCPYEQNRHITETGSVARCMVLTVACGFVVSNASGICEYCISGEAWNDAATVPQLKPEDESRTPPEKDAIALVQESPFFESLYKQSLKARLIGGDCPLYQGPNPVDIGAAFTKYKETCGEVDAEDLLVQMYERQSRLSVADGGDPDEVLADKMAALAEKHGMEEALLEAAISHERAAIVRPIPET